jgi:hypothetical protein
MMLHTLRSKSIQLFNSPNLRVYLILSTLLLAALAGGAPHTTGS